MPIVSCIMAALLAQLLATSSAAQQPAASPTAVLDFEYFRTQVQPILLTKRPGYTRCVVCHSTGGAVGFLQPLSPGATTWSEYQEHIRSDAALDRRLQPVLVAEPSREQAIKILTSLRPEYEKFHGVKITDAAPTIRMPRMLSQAIDAVTAAPMSQRSAIPMSPRR